MSCGDQSSSDGTDSLTARNGNRTFDPSGAAWLLEQAVRYLNSADKDAEAGYERTVEILRRFGDDVLKTVTRLFDQAQAGDASLRWNALYILGDAGSENAADLLVRTALKRLPERQADQGCESARDMELLVSTMAVHAVGRLAKRHPQVSEALLRIVSERPDRAILIEAVKVAAGLGLRDKVRELLPEQDRWILDIRHAHTQEVFADPERENGRERGFTPPKSGDLYTAPKVGCGCKGKEN